MLHYARRLPHWDAIGQPQFVTFRLHGSLAATRGFRREHVATSGEAFVTMDGLLDKGATGPLHLKRPDVAGLVVEALLDSDAQFVPLAKWLGPLKGFTANQAKKALGLRDGAFWQNESYDHLVRSEEEFRAASSDPSSFAGRAQSPPGKAASRHECPPYDPGQSSIEGRRGPCG